MKRFNEMLAGSVFIAAYLVASCLQVSAVQVKREELPKRPGIWLSRADHHKLTAAHKVELVESLQQITGLSGLNFNEEGSLSLGKEMSAKGSAQAVDILRWTLESGFVFIIEDHSDSAAVNFGQLDEGTNYVDDRSQCRLLIWRVRLDFNDFRKMGASSEVRETFNTGFTLLHELLHGLGYQDTRRFEEIGECEEKVNKARVELGLMTRDRYFGDQIKVANRFVTVRLRFSSLTRRRPHYLFFVVPPDFGSTNMSGSVGMIRGKKSLAEGAKPVVME